MILHFSKYQATGNDFIMIDDLLSRFPLDKRFLRKLCHRKFGIGADGVILLQNSEKADYRMRIFNADGSEAESCGNGLLCLSKFIGKEGVHKIELMKEIVEVSYQKGISKVSLNIPSEPFRKEKISLGDLYLIDTGVPHAVIFSDFKNFSHAKKIRDRWNANVNFVEKKDGKIFVQTFERGVEGETFGCGTGAAAVALLSYSIHNIKSPIEIRFKGGSLFFDFLIKDNRLQKLNMLGSVFSIYSGQHDATIMEIKDEHRHS